MRSKFKRLCCKLHKFRGSFRLWTYRTRRKESQLDIHWPSCRKKCFWLGHCIWSWKCGRMSCTPKFQRLDWKCTWGTEWRKFKCWSRFCWGSLDRCIKDWWDSGQQACFRRWYRGRCKCSIWLRLCWGFFSWCYEWSHWRSQWQWPWSVFSSSTNRYTFGGCTRNLQLLKKLQSDRAYVSFLKVLKMYLSSFPM